MHGTLWNRQRNSRFVRKKKKNEPVQIREFRIKFIVVSSKPRIWSQSKPRTDSSVRVFLFVPFPRSTWLIDFFSSSSRSLFPKYRNIEISKYPFDFRIVPNLNTEFSKRIWKENIFFLKTDNAEFNFRAVFCTDDRYCRLGRDLFTLLFVESISFHGFVKIYNFGQV